MYRPHCILVSSIAFPFPPEMMQKEDFSYDALTAADKSSAVADAPLQFFDGNPFLSPASPTYVNSGSSFYSSLFHNCYSNSPTETASFDGGDTDSRLQDASCILEYQQLYNRYKLCVARLHDSIEEVEALRRENDSLRLSNADLSRRIALIFSRDRLLAEFNRLGVASPSPSPSAVVGQRAYHLAGAQPLSENNRVERRSSERVSLPKSISVRSSDYLTMTRHGRESVAGHKAETESQPAAASVSTQISTDVSFYSNSTKTVYVRC